MKSFIKNTLKLVLAFGLIYWLVESGKLDFSLLKKLFASPLTVIIAILLLQFDNGIAAFRLRIILHKKASQSISFLKVYLANWIGIFFNSVLPGSVTGDLIKIFYIQDLDKNFSKRFLLGAVFIDRVVGLLGLVSVGGIVCLLNYQTLVNLSPDVANLIHVNILLTLGVVISLLMIFFFPGFPLLISGKCKKISSLEKIMLKLESIWESLCSFRNKILILLALSMTLQSIIIFIFWYLASPYSVGDLSLVTVFSIMPIGFISISLPIAPAGLGVGHVVFENLLGYFNITNGASLFNIYFFVVLISNLTGVFPYVFYRGKNDKQVDLKQINNLETQP